MRIPKTAAKVLTAVSAAWLTLAAVELLLVAVDYRYTPLEIQSRESVLKSLKDNPNDARVTHAFEDTNFVFDPVLIWRPKPGGGPFNRQGFRGPILASKKADDEYRIFAVGDSNTLGWAGRNGSNWPADLQELLGKPGKPYVVVNAGVYGYASYQGLRRFEAVLAYEPDLALISFGSNDAHPVAVTDSEFVKTTLGATAPILPTFRLGQLFLAAWDRIAVSSLPRVLRVPLAEYDDNLRRIARLAKDRGLICVLMTRPYIGVSSDPNRWKSYAPEYRRHTLEIARSEGLPLIDLYSLFEDRNAYFVDESHFQPEGHRIAAAIVYRKIRGLLATTRLPAESARSELPDHLFLDLGEEQAHPSLGVGFSGDERNELGSFVWNEGPVSWLMLSLDPMSQPYLLSIAAACFPPLAPLQVEVSVNGRSIGRVSFGATPSTARLELPAGVLGWGPNSVCFQYARVERPKGIVANSRDERELALQFFAVSVAPAG